MCPLESVTGAESVREAWSQLCETIRFVLDGVQEAVHSLKGRWDVSGDRQIPSGGHGRGLDHRAGPNTPMGGVRSPVKSWSTL